MTKVTDNHLVEMIDLSEEVPKVEAPQMLVALVLVQFINKLIIQMMTTLLGA